MATTTLGLDEIRRKLREISSPGFRADVMASLAEEARTQIVEGFRSSRSPYDEPWGPLKSRDGKPLLDTGRLRNSLMPRPSASGIEINADVVYAATHNYGRGPIPKRQFLPDEAHGLGSRWTKAFLRTLESAVRKLRG